MNLADLSKPFPQAAVHWRAQGTPIERQGRWIAMALAYLDARDVMDRLDEVCGPENWQSEFTETASGRVICRIGVLHGNDWVWKADGAGGTQVEAEKGGLSDALKRAAVSWGIGRYLYRMSAPWVECEVYQKGGKTYFKKWSQDPWSKVKGNAAPAPADPETPPEKPKERDPRAVADNMLSAIRGAKVPAQLNAILGDARFDADWQWLEGVKPPMSAEIKAAVEKSRDQMPTEAV